MSGVILSEFIHASKYEVLTDIFENTSLKHYGYLQDSIEWKLNDVEFIHSVHCKYVIIVGDVASWIQDIIEYRGTKLTTMKNICNTENLYNSFSRPTIEMYSMHMEEEMYLNLMNSVMKRGQEKCDRTKVGTLSLLRSVS